MGRILAIDYGRRRVGLAVTDPLNITAQGLPTLKINNLGEIIDWVRDHREDWEIERIILGLPRSLSGELGPMAEEVTEFSHRLQEETKLPVELVDERFTSREAHATFARAGKKLKGRKDKIDRIAAVLLLQHYLEMTSPPSNDEDLP
jgi:putative Holliday junction resolvase